MGNFSSRSLSSYVILANSGTLLEALLWTFSMASMCFFRYGLQTDWACSRCGLTRAVKSILNIGASRYSKERLMRPAIELALLILLEICLSKFKLVSITRDCPRQRYWDILPYFSKKSHCYFEMTNFYHWNLIRICAILELVWNSPIVLQVQAYPWITTPKSFSSSDLSNCLPSIEYGQASTIHIHIGWRLPNSHTHTFVRVETQ